MTPPTQVLFSKTPYQLYKAEYEMAGLQYYEITTSGWYTLQWVPEGDAWKLRYWTWQRAGEQAQRDTWNEIYKNAVGFNKQPNK
ncbi:MAG: hypothetical protein H6Q94_1231, partial [Nitrospirae bacterium]|nr:hypothetical protein [Nitrospirota bacterium]